MAKRDVVLLKGILIVFTILLFFSLTKAIEPNGATVNATRTETANASNAGSHQAQAGNITQLNIFAYSTTQSWQGYFGNVSGTIQLADAQDKVLYNWTLAEPQGEVYASTNSSISWTNIQCLNFTATGAYSGTETPGGINLYGTNLTTLETSFGINSSDVDGIDETFTLQHGGVGEHDAFYTANRQFDEGECISTRVYSSSGTGETNKFEEVLLYEPTTASIIFTSIIEPGTVAGFDGQDYDFEMLVLENGHGTDIETTPYYFFVELE
ncbi:MAG: hypothetical protein KKD18_04995 [Nanoarchaeota archaeon]|nr:hypothetical protein [Nanoarchaeota archaeon]MBU0977747.1 hypothetical protein [Nanoarchaeota archaeon]